MSSTYEPWAGRIVRRDDGGRFADDDTSRFLTHARGWLGRMGEQFEARHREHWGRPDPVTGRRYATSNTPVAKRRGFIRVADHPLGEGVPDRSTGPFARTFGTSTHPEAGGLWIDPNNPGTRHAPLFRNDFGAPVSDLRPPRSRTESRRLYGRPMAAFPRTKEGDSVEVVTRRRGVERRGPLGSRGNPEDFAMPYISPQTWKRIMQAKGKVKQRRTWIEKLGARMEGGA
jgi:hypothetical protein